MRVAGEAYNWSRSAADDADRLEPLFRCDGRLRREQRAELGRTFPETLSAARTLAELRDPGALTIPKGVPAPPRLPLGDAVVVASSLEVWCLAAVWEAPGVAMEILKYLESLYTSAFEAWANASSERIEVRLIGASAMIPYEFEAATQRVDDLRRAGAGDTVLARGLARAVEAHSKAKAA